MDMVELQPFRHSGKYGKHALVVVPLAGVVLGWPLGMAYAYLIRWIPFVFLNLVLTLCYGLVFGLMVARLLKWCQVRSEAVGGALAAGVGVLANYFQWNGHVHTLFAGAPQLVGPAGLWGAIRYLYEHGSWAFGQGGNETGVVLAGVWVIEAGLILLLTLGAGVEPLRNLPYCEKNGCWLD